MFNCPKKPMFKAPAPAPAAITEPEKEANTEVRKLLSCDDVQH